MSEREGMRLLIVGDAPQLSSGTGNLVRNLAIRLLPRFARVDFWACGYEGYPGAPVASTGVERQSSAFWQERGCRLYPAGIGEPWHSPPRLNEEG